MKICTPTETDDGLAAAVAGHLGRAPFLTLVDTDCGEVAVRANTPHRDRACSPAQPLAGYTVDVMVCPGAGRHAVATLQAAGICVLLTNALRVDAAVAAARRGLRILTAKEACGGHHASGGTGQSRCCSEA